MNQRLPAMVFSDTDGFLNALVSFLERRKEKGSVILTFKRSKHLLAVRRLRVRGKTVSVSLPMAGTLVSFSCSLQAICSPAQGSSRYAVILVLFPGLPMQAALSFLFPCKGGVQVFDKGNR